MLITAATRPGSPDVPNEDWVALTPDLIVVLDGATVRTDTGCRHGAAWYAQQLGAELSATARNETSLQVALSGAITKVLDRHPECDLEHPRSPSAAVGIVRVRAAALEWLVLGDITVLIDTGQGLTVITDDRVERAAEPERAAAHRWPIGSAEKDAALLAMAAAYLAHRNRPGGYWIASTDPTAAQQARTGTVPAARVRRCALLTDGAARFVDLFRLGDWAAALDVLTRSGPGWLIDRLVRPVELADPRGQRYPRNKRSDDATAVLLDLTAAPSPESVPEERRHAVIRALAGRLNNPALMGERSRRPPRERHTVT